MGYIVGLIFFYYFFRYFYPALVNSLQLFFATTNYKLLFMLIMFNVIDCGRLMVYKHMIYMIPLFI